MATQNLPAAGLPRSLEDIHHSVPIPPRSRWRRFLAFSGPAFLISVGYMDPGNWGTDLEAGSKYGYRLLWVLLLSNFMALLLQSLASRLGIVTGKDLAQTCRESYPRWMSVPQWILCEVAIAACDLAEVIGTVIALKLLFHLPYGWGLIIAAGDTFLLLALQRRGVRVLELVTLGLIGIIACSFIGEIVMARPVWSDVMRGLIPGLDTSTPEAFSGSLYVAIGMLGATVMPHNLYLHSALVQTRAFPQSLDGKAQACKYNLIDSLLALNGAFFVNAAILILSVCSFYATGHDVGSLEDAHHLLQGVWGTTLAGFLFAIALLASGQSSTLTGTLAGQVVMEGFVQLRVKPSVRRMVTRLVAIVPAMVVIALAGHTQLLSAKSVDKQLLGLLILSQVVLSFQLPFAIVPLVQSTSDPQRMGVFASRGWLKAFAWMCSLVVVALNGVLIYGQMKEWAGEVSNPWWIYGTVGPVAVVLAAFLGWIALYPFFARRQEISVPAVVRELPTVGFNRIGVAVELKGTDSAVLAQAAALARAHGALLVALHVVEGTAADLLGPEADDQESRSDRRRMRELLDHLHRDGLEARGVLGYGTPADEITRIVQAEQLDLLVTGTHGHGFLADLALGRTVSPLLHRLSIPVLVVPNRPPAAAAT
jgi:manganese transport protein